jgi:hypothetical protein
MDMVSPLQPPQSAPAQQQSYPPPHELPKPPAPLANGDAPQLNGHHRDVISHTRRGSFRRGPAFGGRGKPPCAFFPSGRCRNGCVRRVLRRVLFLMIVSRFQQG